MVESSRTSETRQFLLSEPFLVLFGLRLTIHDAFSPFYRTLYHLMTPEQKERFDNYRRSGFQESELKEHVLDPLKVHASSEAITVLRAIGKVFIGELMDKGTCY